MVSNSQRVGIGIVPTELDTKRELDTFPKDLCPKCGEPGFWNHRECWNSQQPNARHYFYWFFIHKRGNGKPVQHYIGKDRNGYLTRRRKLVEQVSNSKEEGV